MVYLISEHEVPTQAMVDAGYLGAAGQLYDSINESLHDTIKFTTSFAKIDNRKLYFLLEELFSG